MPNPPDERGLRLAYLSGPVDAVDVYDCWAQERAFSHFGTSYLTQFFELCAETGATSLVITTDSGARRLVERPQARILNVPPSGASGIRYHLTTIRDVLRIGLAVARFRPQAIVLTAHQNYWFLLFFLRLLGIRIILSVHCTLWRPFAPAPLHLRLLLALNGLFMRACVRHAMAISRIAADQVRTLSHGKVSVAELKPTYAPEQFSGLPRPTVGRPFKVLFAGRMEANKGIFDLVEISRQLERDRPGDFQFDLCGEGSDLARVCEAAAAAGLDGAFRIHGLCGRDALSRLLAQSHAVIAPTRSDFEEGLNKSCVEAVLAGRPFISSPVCPAVYSLAPAALIVPPDDVDAYREGLAKLADEPGLYQQKVAACASLQRDYYDKAQGYKESLRRTLEAVGLAGAPSHRSRDVAMPHAAKDPEATVTPPAS